jgi:hypothetical protein
MTALEDEVRSKRACNPDILALPETTVAIVHKQAEECLAGTVLLATAADSRATTLTGIFGGAAVALLAASATVLAAPEHKTYFPLFVAALVAALLLFAAAILCAYACRPIDYFVAGYEPKYLSKSATDLTWMLRYATDDVQVRIDTNREALAAGARKVSWAMRLALISVLASIAAFFIVQSL